MVPISYSNGTGDEVCEDKEHLREIQEGGIQRNARVIRDRDDERAKRVRFCRRVGMWCTCVGAGRLWVRPLVGYHFPLPPRFRRKHTRGDADDQVMFYQPGYKK